MPWDGRIKRQFSKTVFVSVGLAIVQVQKKHDFLMFSHTFLLPTLTWHLMKVQRKWLKEMTGKARFSGFGFPRVKSMSQSLMWGRVKEMSFGTLFIHIRFLSIDFFSVFLTENNSFRVTVDYMILCIANRIPFHIQVAAPSILQRDTIYKLHECMAVLFEQLILAVTGFWFKPTCTL